MSAADLARWQARWQEREGETSAPEPFLIREAGNLPTGPILDVAAGDGRNAVWLAAQGYAVTALDIAPAAIARMRPANGQPEIAIRVADLDAADALSGLGSFGSLVICRFKPSATQWASLLEVLRPDGQVLLCSFRRAQHERYGFPLPYCLDRAELESLLSPQLRLLSWLEFDQPGVLLAGSRWRRAGS